MPPLDRGLRLASRAEALTRLPARPCQSHILIIINAFNRGGIRGGILKTLLTDTSAFFTKGRRDEDLFTSPMPDKEHATREWLSKCLKILALSC